jgi:hypothetical protein
MRTTDVSGVHTMQFDIAGVSVGLEDGDQIARDLVTHELDPFAGAPAGTGDELVLAPAQIEARVSLDDIQGLAADGVVTASDGRQLYAILDDRRASLPDPWAAGSGRIEYESGFPLRRLFSSFIRPSLQVRLALRNAACVHAASVEQDGGAILISGWSESGKTETALALMERGARFLSDKWTVVSSDGLASPFPVNVGVRRWVLPYLPTLRAGLAGQSSMQLRAAGGAAAVLAPVLRRRTTGRFTGLIQGAARQAIALADRAALTPSELRAVFGQRDDATRRIPTRSLVLLTTVDAVGPTIREVPRGWAIERLVRSAAFERRPFTAWLERGTYAFPDRSANVESWLDMDRQVLGRVLESTQLVHIEAPFPTDPRRIADLVWAALR